MKNLRMNLIPIFWRKYDELEREGLSSEEINDIMQKAEETYEALREESQNREKELQDKLNQVDPSNEEKTEDYPKEIVNSDEAQEVLDTVADEEKSEEEIVEELEFQKEKELGSENQDDEEVEADYKEEIGNPAQFQEYRILKKFT